MSDFRTVPKSIIVDVEPDEYERECQWMRKIHKVAEGDLVTIRTIYGFTDVAAIYDIHAIVQSVERYFIRLRYPAGFIVSFRWRDFEFMRLKE